MSSSLKRDSKAFQKVTAVATLTGTSKKQEASASVQEKSRPPSSKGEPPIVKGKLSAKGSREISEKSLGVIPLATHKNFKGSRESIFERHSDEVLLLFRDLLKDYDEVQSTYNYLDSEFPGKGNEQNLDISDEILKSKVKWESVRYVAEEEIKFSFPEIKNNDFWVKSAVKGSLDDFHVLNAIMLIASSKNLFLKMCFRDETSKGKYLPFEQQRLYAFRFYKNKTQTYTVVVDEKIPVVSHPNGKPVPIYSRCANPNEFWISLIEKAYAKLHSSYSNLVRKSLRECVNDFFGLEPEIIPLSKENITMKNFWNFIEIYRKSKAVLALMRSSEYLKDNNKLNKKIEMDTNINAICDKVFIIHDITEKSPGQKGLVIRDPWSGEYSITELMQPGKGKKEASGEFVLYGEDLFKVFNTLITIKDFPDEWSGVKFESEINPSGGVPQPSTNSWINHPQYIFEILPRAGINCVFRVTDIKGIMKLQNTQIGFVVSSLLDKEDKISAITLQRVKANSKSKGEFFTQYNVLLEKGKYCIIPFTSTKDEIAYLNVEVFFEAKPADLRVLTKGSARILDNCEGELPESAPRILHDDFFKAGLKAYEFVMTKEKTNLVEILIPGNAKSFVLTDSKDKGIALTGDNSTQNKQIELFDPQIDNLKENILSEILLGLDGEKGNNDNAEDELDYDEGNEANARGEFDFADYGMQDEGLIALLPILMSQKAVHSLNLSGNELTDDGVVKLCADLEVGHHYELEAVNLSNNSIKSKGAQALLNLCTRMQNLKSMVLDGNDIDKKTEDSIKDAIKARKNNKK